MVTIHIRLHGILRDLLPSEAKGKIAMNLAEGTTISAVLDLLNIHHHIQVALNEEIEDNLDQELHNNDHLDIFRPAAGGTNIF